MKIQILYIIDRKNNVLIFLGILAKGVVINQGELGNILSKIVSKCAKLSINSYDEIQINEKSYILGNYEKLIIIFQCEDSDFPSRELSDKIYEAFIIKFSSILNNYSDSDISVFKTFDAKKILHGNVLSETEKKKEENVVEIKPPTEKSIGETPLINPMKREAFPDGIPEYRRDEVLWTETQLVQDDYVAEYVEGMISHLQVFLSISLTHHYELFIDFSNYPLKPKLSIGKGLKDELRKSLDELLFYLRNWDSKIPAHIVELIREFEAVLMKFKVKGKLSDTAEMPMAALPDLEPLPELPPLEEFNVGEQPKETNEEQEGSIEKKDD